ncbi:hypothetical protein EAO74_09440 [Streptomyces sp. gb1(2016)]|uniref:Uncharacterized protein n=1 Tax=Streptomyces sp. gb1(2016) TaxID=1828321 RepID=A0A652L6U1_9ACTN|nr:hypothetical protein EAO74_09440 [Streptomyces sp. gb1(2016)]
MGGSSLTLPIGALAGLAGAVRICRLLRVALAAQLLQCLTALFSDLLRRDAELLGFVAFPACPFQPAGGLPQPLLGLAQLTLDSRLVIQGQGRAGVIAFVQEDLATLLKGADHIEQHVNELVRTQQGRLGLQLSLTCLVQPQFQLYSTGTRTYDRRRLTAPGSLLRGRQQLIAAIALQLSYL